MPWDMIEDTLAPLMRWHTRLTEAAPDTGPQSLALITGATVQIEGEFGTALVDVLVSNSEETYQRLDTYQDPALLGLPPAYMVRLTAVGADAATDVRVTVVGRR